MQGAWQEGLRCCGLSTSCERGLKVIAWEDKTEDDEARLKVMSRASDLYSTSARRQSVHILQTPVGQVQRDGTVFDPHHWA
jgi:hypothetical protein